MQRISFGQAQVNHDAMENPSYWEPEDPEDDEFNEPFVSKADSEYDINSIWNRIESFKNNIKESRGQN